MARKDRDTIFVEEATILEHRCWPNEQYVMRVKAPECAATAKAGMFAHVQCDPLLPMRRPLSIMRVDATEGWMEFLYKTVGQGLALLAKRQPGDTVSTIGPIGNPFNVPPTCTRPLFIGGGVGIPPMIFLADEIQKQDGVNPVVLMGSEVPFPFELATAKNDLAGVDNKINQTIKLLEDWSTPTRLASLAGFDGCYQGYVTELGAQHLRSLSKEQRANVEIFACGPTSMLKAVAQLARDFKLPAQVSLEEHMACAVGGCAGCTVLVKTDQGPAMKRVCVDGPVFDAYEIV